jgi:hypothetical protein
MSKSITQQQLINIIFLIKDYIYPLNVIYITININNEFVVKYFSGSNIGVENSNGDPYSLNRDRFKLKEVQN